MPPIDLDVDVPEKVPEILRKAAETYYDSAVELEGAWQDRQAGKVWSKIAAILENAADKAEMTIQREMK